MRAWAVALLLLPAAAFGQTKTAPVVVPIAPGLGGPLAPVAAPAVIALPLAASLPHAGLSPLALPKTAILAPARSSARAERLAPGILGGLQSAVGRLLGGAAPAAEPEEVLDGLFDRSRAGSGIDASAFDPGVRPQDDFFRYANGGWLAAFRMPADKSRFGSFDQLSDKSELAVKAIVDEAVAAGDAAAGEQRRVADLYRSFMDEERLEALGTAPIDGRLRAIDRIASKAALPRVFASSLRSGGGAPVGFAVGQDAKRPDRHTGGLFQTGLGLPDRDYYFNEGVEAEALRGKYREYLARLFTLAGEGGAREKAERVFALEKALAGHHWTTVENRDSERTYNMLAVSELGRLAPGFDWTRFLRAAGLPRSQTQVDVGQPSYLTGFARVVGDSPLEDWKLYLKARLLDEAGGYLTSGFFDARFDFYGRTLSGQPEPRPRWKRGVSLVEGALGESIGRLYVERHFPPEAAARARRLVDHVIAAYVARISAADWMEPATRAKALEKLERLTVKIGGPERVRDLSGLDLRPGDLFGNIRRASRFEYRRMLARLHEPVDRAEWGMNPQDVNAYYSPIRNEIVFPAAILQAPFFDPGADDAVNYGAIGAIIGHEITHGFDDEGSKFDAQGALNDWWTPADRAKFEARGRRLIAQADAFEGLPGKFVNGRNTLGENIADLGGLTIAYDAYRLSLGGREAPVIGGLTGDQRFFLGWAQAWRTAQRDEALALQMATDEHPPEAFRVNNVLSNLPAFHRAFGVRPGDRLYRAPEHRAAVW
ncbi:MAG: M13 family metallopeptidase [Elusimicrobia bacterium]|nr:M13 family metallopeptidase [Elusimicrobiota bacterium]